MYVYMIYKAGIPANYSQDHEQDNIHIVVFRNMIWLPVLFI